MELVEKELLETIPASDPATAGAIVPARPGRGIGVIVPNDFTIDQELWRWAPASAPLHITRLPVSITSMTADVVAVLTDTEALTQATEALLLPEPSVIAYACSSASFLHGMLGEHRLVDAMLAAQAAAAITTSGAMVEALRSISARRVSLVTPYVPAIALRLREFLSEHDVDVVAEYSLGLDRRIWEAAEKDIHDAVLLADHPDADAVFISCTNIRSYDLIPQLEQTLGKPVLSANQVTMWSALRHAGHTIDTNQLLFTGQQQRLGA